MSLEQLFYFLLFILILYFLLCNKVTVPRPVEAERVYKVHVSTSELEMRLGTSQLRDNYIDDDDDDDDDDPNEIQAENSNSDTDLHVAVRLKNVWVASDLIRNKPESSYYLNSRGISPLHLAVDAGLDHTVEVMFRRLPGNRLSEATVKQLVRSKNAFLAHSAIHQRKFAMLRLLLHNLPSLVKSQDERGWKPLSLLAYKGYDGEVSYVLEKFPRSAKMHDKDGSFPIHKAASGGHIRVIAEFFARCPETMFQKDRKQRTILDVAVRYDKPQVFDYLKQEHRDQFDKMHDQLQRG